MEFYCKHFHDLSNEELMRIYHLRTKVFVVEQNCPYQEVDLHDQNCYHLWYEEDGQMIAYARVLPAHETFDTPSIGRIISMKRRCGLGTKIVTKAMEVAMDQFNAEKLTIEAQVYARTLYEKCGFHQTSEPFIEDGIPHILMEWDKNER